jgi:hypothetical protein
MGTSAEGRCLDYNHAHRLPAEVRRYFMGLSSSTSVRRASMSRWTKAAATVRSPSLSRRGLSLTLRDDPMLHTNALPGVRIRADVPQHHGPAWSSERGMPWARSGPADCAESLISSC